MRDAAPQRQTETTGLTLTEDAAGVRLRALVAALARAAAREAFAVANTAVADAAGRAASRP